MPSARRAPAVPTIAALCALAAAAAAQAPAAKPAAPVTPPSTPAPAPSSAPAAAANVDAVEGEFDLTNALRAGSETMTADQAAARAVKSAPSVARAKADSAKAREGASQALVGVWPRLDLQASYTRLSEHEPPNFGSFSGEIMPMGQPPIPLSAQVQGLPTIPDLFQLQATLTYPVSDLFFQILPRNKAASEIIDAQVLSGKAEEHTVALAAREAFYNYARARATLEVARSSLAAAQAQQRDVRSLVSAGTLARVELMRADAGVAAASVAVARAEGGVAVARTALRSLLHVEGETDVGIGEELNTPLPAMTESKEALLQRALRSRSELAALRVMLRVHEHTRDANAAEGYPKLGINGAAELSNPNPRVAPGEKKFEGSWQASAVLSWSPNDYAASRARAGQAAADRESTFAQIAQLEDALRTEVAQAYEDYLAAGHAMEAALTGIAAAEESYRVRREQFRAGAAVMTDVVDAEAELRRARLELVNAAIDVRIARARLDRAIEAPPRSAGAS